ncbi:MAG: anti-sigma factor antagonist [Pseudonocardiaceae bacterium]|nr:anti-sigma factor antagonist [Pseudonocardiaceae bacterium]
MRIDVERPTRGVVLAHVSGEVDILAAPTLRECIDEHLSGAGGLVLDLDGVGFLGSSGLSVLVETGTRVAKTELKWAVVASRHAVTRPLQATGLDDALPLYETVDDAMDAVAA